MLQWRLAVLGFLCAASVSVPSLAAEVCSTPVEMMEFEVVVNDMSSRVFADPTTGFEILISEGTPYIVRIVPVLDPKKPVLYVRYEYKALPLRSKDPILVGEATREVEFGEASDLALPPTYRVTPIGLVTVCAAPDIAPVGGNCCLTDSSGTVTLCGCNVQLDDMKCCRNPCCGGFAV